MALPSAYLTSSKNLPAILSAIANAQAPERFTQKYLESLGFSGTADRLIINVLKSLGFLSDTGQPQKAYHEFLDGSQSKRVLADGIRLAYSDIFQVNVTAQDMTQADVKNKMKTLSEGNHSDAVLTKMAMTFKKLSAQADFAAPETGAEDQQSGPDGLRQDRDDVADETVGSQNLPDLELGSFVYNINLHLPESRDPAVYDALFKSLRRHLK